MPKYSYKAVNEAGKTITGTTNADTLTELHNRLGADGLYLLSATSTETKQRSRPLKATVLADFCRQLGTLLQAGITIVRSLSMIAEDESTKPADRLIYENLYRLIRTGMPFSDALEQQGAAFPSLMVHMIRSSEADGHLDRNALRLADHYTKEYKRGSKVKSALVYPEILLGLIVVVVFIMMKVVLPRFADLFSQMETIPLATRILMGLSGFVGKHWIGIIIGALALYLLKRLLMLLPAVQMAWAKMLLKMPLVGKQMRIICTARFARTLSSLYSSGIPIVATLQIAKTTVGNCYIEKQFESVIPMVCAGNPLSASLATVQGFSKKLISSIRIGEESGQMDKMLDSIADMLDHESEMAIGRLITLMEPVMLILMAAIVAFIIAAIIVPIYTSYSSIGAKI